LYHKKFWMETIYWSPSFWGVLSTNFEVVTFFNNSKWSRLPFLFKPTIFKLIEVEKKIQFIKPKWFLGVIDRIQSATD
jgi:hypothetical protein